VEYTDWDVVDSIAGQIAEMQRRADSSAAS